ncbi:MAG TPA: hypothetical protein PKE47_09540 [Verrucomicrobiota bacterium]|nr:hypothetical protein [Verrucomicrobiota bacterium]
MTVTLNPAAAAVVERLVARGDFPDVHAAVAAAVARLGEDLPVPPPMVPDVHEDSPELEALLLEAVRGPHEPYRPEELRDLVRDVLARKEATAGR